LDLINPEFFYEITFQSPGSSWFDRKTGVNWGEVDQTSRGCRRFLGECSGFWFWYRGKN
jgi:hypothetical protein